MSTEVKMWFSASELALLGRNSVASLPTTLQGCKWRANSDNWIKREVPGKGGPGGVRTEYRPPVEVQGLIDVFLQNNPGFFADKRPVSRGGAAAPAADHKVEQPLAPYDLPPVPLPGDDLMAEAVIRLTYIVRNHPKLSRLPNEIGQRVALHAYRFVLLYCNNDIKLANLLIADADRITDLVYLAYESLCLQRGIAPGSDFNDVPWYQIHRKIL